MLKSSFINVPLTMRFGLFFDSSGIDGSNVPEDYIEPLPKDPCKSADRIRKYIRRELNKDIAVIITDTVAEAQRTGALDRCIGCAGIYPLEVNETGPDLFKSYKFGGNIVITDAIASFAGVVMGGNVQMTPVAIVRGLEYQTWEESDCEKFKNIVSFPQKTKTRSGILIVLDTIIFKLVQYLLFLRNKN